jgi:hypothetical protein
VAFRSSARGGAAALAALAMLAWSPVAHAARVLHASDQAHLRYVSASGSTLYETGKASGTLPGSMHVHMRIAATFSGNFVIYAQGGTIEGHGTATPHGSGVYESFAGTLIVSGGSGRYSHAHGTAGLYGTFNRDTYALVVKTTGNLHY